MSGPAADSDLDRQNADFWSELCGTGLAISLGITGDAPGELARFDRAYWEIYPYLESYLARLETDGPVLEIGLGYGTVGQHFLDAGADYHGLDIAPGPVAMMQHRARLAGRPHTPVVEGSALEIPWPDDTFQTVVSIGCLHHTGNLGRGIDEIHRVLRPGGVALVMLYNRHSLRQIAQARAARRRQGGGESAVRALYDTNVAGEAAPHTDFVSRREAQQLFGGFSEVAIDVQNFDNVIYRGRLVIERKRLLGNIGRLLGLDLYIKARKTGDPPPRTR